MCLLWAQVPRNSLTGTAWPEIPQDFQPPGTHLCRRLHRGPENAPAVMSAGPPLQALLKHVPALSTHLPSSSSLPFSQQKGHHPPSCLSHTWGSHPCHHLSLLADHPVHHQALSVLPPGHLHPSVPPSSLWLPHPNQGYLWPSLAPNWSLGLPPAFCWQPERSL